MSIFLHLFSRKRIRFIHFAPVRDVCYVHFSWWRWSCVRFVRIESKCVLCEWGHSSARVSSGEKNVPFILSLGHFGDMLKSNGEHPNGNVMVMAALAAHSVIFIIYAWSRHGSSKVLKSICDAPSFYCSRCRCCHHNRHWGGCDAIIHSAFCLLVLFHPLHPPLKLQHQPPMPTTPSPAEPPFVFDMASYRYSLFHHPVFLYSNFKFKTTSFKIYLNRLL